MAEYSHDIEAVCALKRYMFQAGKHRCKALGARNLLKFAASQRLFCKRQANAFFAAQAAGVSSAMR